MSREIKFENTANRIQPLMLASRSSHKEIQLLLHEIRFIHKTLEDLKKTPTTKEEIKIDIKNAMNQFYSEKKLDVTNDDIDKVVEIATKLSDNTKEDDYRLIAQLIYGGFERLRKFRSHKAATINPIDDFLSNTFFNKKNYPELVFYRPERNKQPYNKLIMIYFSDDFAFTVTSSGKDIELYQKYSATKNKVLYHFAEVGSGVRRLYRVDGTVLTNIGEDTKVVITGNLHFQNAWFSENSQYLEVYNQNLVRSLLSPLEMVIPRNTNLQSIEFAFYNSAQSITGSEGMLDISQRYVVPEVLRELAIKSIRANYAVAVREFVSADDQNRPSTSKDKPGQSIVFTLKPSNIVEYQAKSLDFENELIGAISGVSIDDLLTDEFADDTDLISAITSDDSIEPDLKRQMIDSLVKYKSASVRPGEVIDARSAINARPEGASVRLMHEEKSDFAIEEQNLFDSLVEYELTKKNAQHFGLFFTFKGAIFHGLLENPGSEKFAFVNPDITETIHLSDTLSMAGQSSSYTEWLTRYEQRYRWLGVSRLQQLMDHFQGEEAKTRAFETLKRRIQADAYSIHRVDIGTAGGAAEINGMYVNQFAYIELLENQLPGSCNRRRRTANTGSCDARRKALTYALRLLSGPKTQLYLDDNIDDKKDKKTDIALLKPANEGQRWLQNFFTRYRRLEAKDALADTRGMHSVIALDKDSFTRAQQQIKDGTLSGQPLLLKTTPSGSYVLLTPDGRVQSAIAGGDGNRVTVLGRPARLIAHALTTLAYFTPDIHIASLTVSDLASSKQSGGITALNALKTFVALSPSNGKPLVGKLIIEPRSRSPEVFKRLVKDIQRLMPKDRPAIESLVLRSQGTGQPEYRLLPGEKTVLMSPRPSDSKALIRYLPPSHLSVPEQPRTKDNLSGVASERAEFRQRLLEFDTALRDIKARHSLADNMVPQLDTLRRDGRGWRMDFVEPDTLARKNIRFTSGAFDRFRGFLQGTSRQGLPSLAKGKRTAAGNMDRLSSFIGLFDLIAGISPVGHHYNHPPRNMTDTERQIYIGRQTFFYTSLALQLIDIINVGRHGVKVIIPAIMPSMHFGQKAPKLPNIPGSGKFPVGLKKIGKLGKSAGRFVPFLLPGVQAGSLTLTIIEYENEKDPEVKKLMESRVIFESVDTGISILAVFANPVVGIMLGGLMHHIRVVFNLHYESEARKLAYKKLGDASVKAAKIFDLIHAQLDPGSFLANNQANNHANNQTLNALTSGDGKSLLALNIQSINLVNQTLTYGPGYSFQTTFVAGKKDDWERCEDDQYVRGDPIEDCASDINRIEYSTVLFNMVDDALATLCRRESRLTGYQCSSGVFHNLGQMTDKKIILMPGLPQWEIKLRYSPETSKRYTPGSGPDGSSPGARFLDAVSDDKLKRFYQKKVKGTRFTECKGGSCSVRYQYKYLVQMFTHTDALMFRKSTSSLYLDNKDYLVVFRHIKDEYSERLSYDLYSPEGADKTYILMSDGAHRIRVHPRGISTWVLNYDGQEPYACVTEQADQVKRCWFWQTYYGKRTWHITLGETRFEFPEPRSSSPYKVVARDANGLFEWRSDGKVIHRLYDNGTLNDRPSRASKLNRIMSRYNGASRFLPLELKDCDASPRIRERCMAEAPERWLTIWLTPERPYLWPRMTGRDPLPIEADERASRVEENVLWRQHKQRCDRQVNEYLKQPYRCFPGKLGLAEADWGQLDRVRLWYDTLNHQEIPLIVASAQMQSDQVQPIQGQPIQVQPIQGKSATGYYFFDSANGKVLFQNKETLTREIRHFQLNASLFGRNVSRIVPNKDESQLLVFDAPYYYLLTASPSGQLTHQAIALETLDDQLSVPPVPPVAASNTTASNTRASDHGLISMRVVDKYDKRRTLRAGFYDDATRTHFSFLSSLFDGYITNSKSDGSRIRVINERVRRVLREEHLPVHKVVWGKKVYYIMFSKHSGNLHYLSTDMDRPGSVQRLSSGFQLIRPAGENRTVAEMAVHHIFIRVQAHSGSLLADTLGGYRLWIPDKAWGNTRVVNENLSVESRPFKHWQVEATGQMVAKSNDTLSVRQFTPQSGVVMDSMDLGQILYLVFAKVTHEHRGTTWTTASARFFISALKKRLRSRVVQAREQFSATVGLVPLRPITAITDHPLLSSFKSWTSGTTRTPKPCWQLTLVTSLRSW
ncbi:hypothetical protein [Endozoicomonas sp. 4G]|uniref:hypothetical protein n=1 Tax=Endozoicomonas sp. 4G TaxID=2872754 RepID=UPI0020789B27|nr:hypothetical protein [Endozoicomonas sp. 4G]